MKALKFCLVVMFPAVFLFCVKKKYPDPLIVENTAVYYSKLMIDNQAINMQAGVDGYYMYSSYKLDSNSVYGFIADLKKADCSDCSNSLRIQINDYQVSMFGGASLIDSSLHKGFYPLLPGNPVPSYSMQFFPVAQAASYSWDFGDGEISTEEKPFKTFSKANKYTVCLTSTSSSGCVSTICNRINVSPNSLKANVGATTGSANTINFKSTVSGGKEPYEYLWSFGDGSSSTQKDPSHAYRYIGANKVTLRVIDLTGDTLYVSYNAITGGDYSSCAANFGASNVKTLSADLALSHIIITWKSEDGTIYTSNSELQPKDSSFEVLSVSENEKNELGQSTKKIIAKFNCKLFNGTKSITVNDAEVVVCVAYK